MKHLILISFVFISLILNAAAPKNLKRIASPKPPTFAACVAGTSQTDLKVNNVRARLLMGGDMWWDGKNVPKYIVPNVAPGQKEVSSIFAGGLWIAGKDATGNIKLTATSYRTSGIDMWPGPLDENGATNDTICSKWDRFFEVFSEDIESHKKLYDLSIKNGTKYNLDDIPKNVKYWPGKNNPYFYEKYLFQLPVTNQGLAPFFDKDGDDIYNPLNGDYPTLPSGSHDSPVYADQMIYSIINDAANIHFNSKGSEPIHLEIQKLAYSFITNDEANNSTFYYNKLIYKGTDLLNQSYFSIWMDPDLGCATDDYVGCDTTRNLMYVYNQDAFDGSTGCNCGTTPTYCDRIPMLGCTFLSGPLAFQYDSLTGNPIDTFRSRMSSFTIYVNGGGIYGPSGSDPATSQEYYNYMSGKWKNGTPITFGGSGYDISSSKYTNFIFSGEPCKENDWSMASVGFLGQDFRTIQSTGPFEFLPGQSNEITYAIVWTPDVPHPKPCLDKIRAAADYARNMLNDCFKYLKGPDAPELTIINLDKSLRISFNNFTNSNNYLLGYNEMVLGAPKNTTDSLYRFEGYKIYQLLDESVNQFQTNDTTKAKLVFQCDLKNNVTNIKNWTSKFNPVLNEMEHFGKEMIEVPAANAGIPQSITITKDVFNNENIKNNQYYYYCVVAYGYNNYEPFDTKTGVGQRTPYVESTRLKKIYHGRPDLISAIKYSDSQPIVTRLEGTGTGSNFLEIDRKMRDSLFFKNNSAAISYKPLNSPIKILVLDPTLTQNKKFELSIFDENMDDTVINNTAKWKLKDLNNPSDSVISANSISQFNETVLSQYGFAISLNQVDEPGSKVFTDKSNGFVGVKKLYNSYPGGWLNTIENGYANTTNGIFSAEHLRFMSTSDQLMVDVNLDPFQSYSKSGNTFFPYGLADYRGHVLSGEYLHYNTPGYLLESTFGPVSRGALSNLNNVDIVLTPDKSKWSRCIVVETADAFYTNKKIPTNILTNNYLGLETVKNPLGKVPLKFDLRGDLSVGKSDSDNDGKPDPDGAKDSDGAPLYGMGWFPGYAIDIETGKRLNIFFGENSCYRKELEQICPKEYQNGADMLWNPNDKVVINDMYNDNPKNTYSHYAGGQHYIYVHRSTYDECGNLRKVFNNTNKSLKSVALRNITWTTLPIMYSNKPLKPLGNGSKGLIPSEVIIEMRVDNPYLVQKENGYNNGYPTYLFSFPKMNVDNKSDEAGNPKLSGSKISLSPNPFSLTSHNTLNIDNLDAGINKVSIYSLNGNIVDQFESNDINYSRNISEKRQKLSKGVYLVQIQNEQMESKILKLIVTE